MAKCTWQTEWTYPPLRSCRQESQVKLCWKSGEKKELLLQPCRRPSVSFWRMCSRAAAKFLFMCQIAFLRTNGGEVNEWCCGHNTTQCVFQFQHLVFAFALPHSFSFFADHNLVRFNFGLNRRTHSCLGKRCQLVSAVGNSQFMLTPKRINCSQDAASIWYLMSESNHAIPW